jgi:hypothetical protein
MERLRANVDKIRGPGGWDNLPGPVKTAFYDISINSGPNVFDEDNTPKLGHRDVRHTNMIALLRSGDVDGMIAELKDYGMKNKDLNRRYADTGDYLRDAQKKGELGRSF